MASLQQTLRHAGGFIFLQLLGGMLIAAMLMGVIGYTYMSVARSSSTAQLRTQSGNMLQQAAYILAAETNASGTYPVPPGTTLPLDGVIPVSSGAPKSDAWGTPIHYCTWANDGGGQSSIVFAVISAGADKTVDTTCADARANHVHVMASGALADDRLVTMSVSQLAQGVGGTHYLGDPVNTYTDLAVLSVVKTGQLRVAKDTGVLYRNTGDGVTANTWAQVSGPGGGGGAITSVPNYAALAGTGADGDMRLALDSGAVFVKLSGAWRLITANAATTGIVASTPANFSVLKNTALALSTVFTVSGGTPPYYYSLGSSLLSPVVADITTNSIFKITSNGVNVPNATSTNSYTVTVTDSMGYNVQASFGLNIINWVLSTGYGLTSGANMNPAGPFTGAGVPSIAGPDCSTLPGGLAAWAGVPSMKIPNSQTTTQTVAAFCVMRYPAIAATPPGTGPAVAATSASSVAPWVNIAWSTLTANPNPCSSMTGTASGATLMRESQWMAIAHNMVGMPANWVNGTVDNAGGMYQGLRDGSVSGAQAANYVPAANAQRRDKTLSTGVTLFDIGGHMYQLTYNDLPGNSGGLYGPSMNIANGSAPYASSTMGMGLFPGVGSNWSGSAPVRGGYWSTGASAGPFHMSNSGTAGVNPIIGFRCTK